MRKKSTEFTKGCEGCPFLGVLSFGYEQVQCNIEKRLIEDKYLFGHKKYADNEIPPPKWCPLRTLDITVKLA